MIQWFHVCLLKVRTFDEVSWFGTELRHALLRVGTVLAVQSNAQLRWYYRHRTVTLVALKYGFPDKYLNNNCINNVKIRCIFKWRTRKIRDITVSIFSPIPLTNILVAYFVYIQVWWL